MIVRTSAFVFLLTAASAADLTHFEKRIRPLLEENCIDCHGPKKQKGGLRLDSRAGWQTGGDSGPALVPGKLTQSRLWRAISYTDRDLKMPPDGKLGAREMNDLKQWIESGAPDPREEPAQTNATHSRTRAGADFWSFQVPKAQRPPAVKMTEWPINGIDRFILAKLEAHGLQPAPEADAHTLLRRISFDLTGLPPKQSVLTGAGAYEHLVDSLLASPAFAERFASHWLDITRFAESSGGGRSLPFKDAWRFRDYVLESLRDNVPIDRMITEHIAGDLLPYRNAAQRRRQLTATGFLALGPTNYEEQDKGQLRMDIVDEQLDTLGRAFLGMTLGCARCHDHKFDPIPTRDYYALAGILRSTRTLRNYTDNVAHWIDTPLPLDGAAEIQMQQREKLAADLKNEIAILKDKLRDAGSANLRKRHSISPEELPGIVVDDDAAQKVGQWKHSTLYGPFIGSGYASDQNENKGSKTLSFTPKIPNTGRYEVRLAFNAGPGRAESVTITILHADGEDLKTVKMSTGSLKGLRFASLGTFRFEAGGQGFVLVSNAASQGYVTVDAVQFLPEGSSTDSSIDPAVTATLKAKLTASEARLKEVLNDNNARPEVMSVAEDAAPEDARIHIRGSIRNLGATVPRGFIQAASPSASRPNIPTGSSGRLQLAQWITSRSNPLTARVMVNHVWHWIFGAGIVRTADNFGSTGEAPSHPQLLDHLAVQFMDNGWDLKWLVKAMVMSRTYRMSSRVTPTAQDPDNRLLSHMNRKRLDAECLWDAMLATAGTLRRDFGGPGIQASAVDANSSKSQNLEYSHTFDSTRRSLYTAAFRNVRHPLFEVFDFADINQPISQRTTSTVATQALFLMNSPKVIAQARAAAEMILGSDGGTRELVTAAFQRALQRPPAPRELEQACHFLDASSTLSNEDTRDLWARFIQTLWATPEFRFLD